MKKLLLALAALTVMGSAVAYAQNCQSNCRWIGAPVNQWQCNQTCSQ
jgi:hypothetical protein